MKKTILNHKAIGIIVLSCLYWGCLELPNYEKIDKLRVLAIRADKPQVAVDETVKMDALVATPTDEKVSLSWQVCSYVRSADTKRTCPKKAILKKGTGDTFEFSVDAETAVKLAPLCEGEGELVKSLPNDAELPICTEDGYPLVVRVTAKTEKETVVAVKKVAVLPTLPEKRLENPVIEGFEHLPESVRAGQTYIFSVEVEGAEQQTDDGDPPHGSEADGGIDEDAGSVEEEAPPVFRYSWFLRGGDSEYLKDEKIDKEPETAHIKVNKDAKDVTVWIVVRDLKFGVDWRRLDF